MNIRLLFSILSVLSSSVVCGSHELYWTETYLKATEGYWGQLESSSGTGSSLKQTVAIRQALPNIIKKYNITSILDVPCGDFNWMQAVDLGSCYYVGCEIVKPLVEKNIEKHGDQHHIFLHADVTQDALPQVDLIVCRDLFVHLSLNEIKDAILNFKHSGAKYLLATTFLWHRDNTNSEIKYDEWRPVNLQKDPFNFPAPIFLINEKCTEQNGIYRDKSMGLWLLEDVKFCKCS